MILAEQHRLLHISSLPNNLHHVLDGIGHASPKKLEKKLKYYSAAGLFAISLVFGGCGPGGGQSWHADFCNPKNQSECVQDFGYGNCASVKQVGDSTWPIKGGSCKYDKVYNADSFSPKP